MSAAWDGSTARLVMTRNLRVPGITMPKHYFRKSRTLLLVAIRLDAGYSEAYYLLARYYQKVGEEQLAKETFAKFDDLKKNPVPSPFGLRRY
jgi:hypothetical protein